MLYPFPFPFNAPSSSSSSSSSSTPTPLPLHLLSSYSSSTSIQVEQGMDYVEGSLKSGFRPEMAVKQTQQPVLEDLAAVNGQTGVSGDDFSVDDLLDFSTEGIELEDPIIKEEEEDNHELSKAWSVFVLPPKQDQKAENVFGSVPGSEISVPADDLADLEWLSHFVDDSFPEYPLTFTAGKLPEKVTCDRSDPEIPVSKNPCFFTPVQTKARSKRARTGGRVWSLGSSPPTATETSSSSTSSSSSSTPTGWLIYAGPSQTAESFFGKPPVKKQRKAPASEAIGGGGGGGGAHPPRRCSHCLVQKTPQWRSGPLGAKTLCNACGVRYKSGRLLPEYRPACSPTFSSDVHSNNHRKVLEMRQKKELVTGLTQPVQSF